MPLQTPQIARRSPESVHHPHKNHDEHRQCNPGGGIHFAVLLGSDNSCTTPFEIPFLIRSPLWWRYMVGGPLRRLRIKLKSRSKIGMYFWPMLGTIFWPTLSYPNSSRIFGDQDDRTTRSLVGTRWVQHFVSRFCFGHFLPRLLRRTWVQRVHTRGCHDNKPIRSQRRIKRTTMPNRKKMLSSPRSVQWLLRPAFFRSRDLGGLGGHLNLKTRSRTLR